MTADVIVLGPIDDEVVARIQGGTRRVTVLAPFQVVHEGTVYLPGQTADAPEHLAAQWITNGWVTE